MRVKLLTIWFGKTPDWIDQFRERMDSNKMFSWELIQPESVEDINLLVEQETLIPSQKAYPYALCDLRPLFGRIFHDRIEGYDWWGWCDLDIAVGNLDRLLGTYLKHFDIITTDPHVIHGPMTLLRNSPPILDLYREEDIQSVLEDPEYCNFDETGFATGDIRNDNPSFDKAVKRAEREGRVKVYREIRVWTESDGMLPDGIPARSCEMFRNRLIEVPTGRELILYHFAGVWPLPNRFSHLQHAQREWLARDKTPRLQPMYPTVPEESPAFWEARVRSVLSRKKELHLINIDAPLGDWMVIQERTRKVCLEYLKPGDRLLDAGCGYGSLLEVLEGIPLSYTGIDYCPAMIDLARSTYPEKEFLLADLRAIPLPSDSYDWCVCRMVEGSIRTLLSNKAWKQMQGEMLRVARRLLLIDSSCKYRIVERGGHLTGAYGDGGGEAFSARRG